MSATLASLIIVCCMLSTALAQSSSPPPPSSQNQPANAQPTASSREAKDGTPEIEVMTNTVLLPPMHPRKQAKCFGDMSKNDQHQAS